MEIQKYEEKIIKELKPIIETILRNNPQPTIAAKSRAGAEISDLLEKQFVIETKKHTYFKNSASSPEGATKNPWDTMTYFNLNGHEELIWIDFKAIKISSKDSNPDIGTPDKVFDLIKQGAFYLVYIFVYYKETDKGLEFVKNSDNEFVKIYFLKDISHTFRRNPKNQLQVNISAKPEYRSRIEFINLLLEKVVESHKRQIEKSNRALKKFEESGIKDDLLAKNKEQEERIKKI